MTVRSRPRRPLVVLGPTASGKTALAVSAARAIGRAEIVGVDSMQVYRGMEVGTAQPSGEQRGGVAHHLIGFVDPAEEYTVGAFQREARRVVAAVAARGATPVLAGGTGLYVRAVVDDLDIPGRYPDTRRVLEQEADTASLHRRLAELDPEAAARMEPTNRRRVIRALEVTLGSGRPFSSHGPGLTDHPPTRFVQVGLRWDRAELDDRIRSRLEEQLAAGFLAEVARLDLDRMSRSASQALGYRELGAHLRGEVSLDEAVEQIVARTRRFARRQERWFRRDPRISWVDGPGDAATVLAIWEQAADTPAG